jgi:signal transduction histidine kinase
VRGRIYTSQTGIGLQEVVGDALRDLPGSDAWKDARGLFLHPYDERHMLISARDETLRLYDGAQALPFPTAADEYLKKSDVYTSVPLPDGGFCLTTTKGGVVIIERDYASDAGMIDAIPQDLSRVFLNLLNNACYAVNERAKKNGAGFTPTLRVKSVNLGDAVEIRIRDNGMGIPPDVRDKIFNPFFTTKPTGQGTGLGLSISHDIVVQQHGGQLEVETEPGEFTEFIVRLPRTRRGTKSF